MILIYAGVEESLSKKYYTDASLTTYRDDYKSRSGYVFIINGGVVSWNSSKQSVVAQSTTELEYISTSEAT